MASKPAKTCAVNVQDDVASRTLTLHLECERVRLRQGVVVVVVLQLDIHYVVIAYEAGNVSSDHQLLRRRVVAGEGTSLPRLDRYLDVVILIVVGEEGGDIEYQSAVQRNRNITRCRICEVRSSVDANEDVWDFWFIARVVDIYDKLDRLLDLPLVSKSHHRSKIDHDPTDELFLCSADPDYQGCRMGADVNSGEKFIVGSTALGHGSFVVDFLSGTFLMEGMRVHSEFNLLAADGVGPVVGTRHVR